MGTVLLLPRCDRTVAADSSERVTPVIAEKFDVVEGLARKNTSQRQVPRPRRQAEPQTDGANPLPSAEAFAPTVPASLSADSDASLETVVNQQLVEHGLVDFFQHGISSQSWAAFDRLSEARSCYVGTSLSNLAFLVGQERSGDNSHLHYPIPQIHRIVPWKPEPKTSGLQLRQSLESDLGSFPAKDIRDALVEAFFTDIHPLFPVVDESEFRQSHTNKESPPPLLLFQAILLAGAHVCDHPKVAQSRALVKATLFRRAKTLWDLRFENDRITLVQAALLFSWHVENPDTVSANSYYWISVACGIAFGLGMHRNLTASTTAMPVFTRKLIRRIWWTLFQAAVFSALDHGRPLLIRRDDTDQPPLTEEDLVEFDGTKNQKICLQYSIHNSTLCEIVADLLDMFSPGALQRSGAPQHTSFIDARLASWLMLLPQGDDFSQLQLRLHYNAAVLHCHRTVSQHADASSLSSSQRICAGAAETILSIFGTMIQEGTVQRCYFTALTAIMASAIHFIRDLRLAAEHNSTLLALQSHAKLESCFPILKELACYWPTANAALKLFQHVLDRTKCTMNAHFDITETSTEPISLSDKEFATTDWEYIFSTLHTDAPLPDWSSLEARLAF
ncbi:hypothetical protein H2200_006747 [Cladophialophora chaetospira]|uniref:Xylanolytic transcriptional activator regulatory domain-containing protein n=1 Tax=Cladophialophora chaetospira TaxID=386627 RepID=A0AA38X8S4_9EURO|nr:hypothetical protein H2200_006747 [Cladophialophora chaetospira]